MLTWCNNALTQLRYTVNKFSQSWDNVRKLSVFSVFNMQQMLLLKLFSKDNNRLDWTVNWWPWVSCLLEAVITTLDEEKSSSTRKKKHKVDGVYYLCHSNNSANLKKSYYWGLFCHLSLSKQRQTTYSASIFHYYITSGLAGRGKKEFRTQSSFNLTSGRRKQLHRLDKMLVESSDLFIKASHRHWRLQLIILLIDMMISSSIIWLYVSNQFSKTHNYSVYNHVRQRKESNPDI